MEWTFFVYVIVIIYAVWYAANLLRDVLFVNAKPTVSNSKHYSLEGLIEEDTSVVEVHQDFNTPETGVSDSPPLIQEKKDESFEQDVIQFTEAPENQGLALKDFLSLATKEANEVSQRVAFN